MPTELIRISRLLWEQYNKAVDQTVRKDLIAKIQKMIYEKVMWIPLTNTNSPAALGPRVKGNPYKIQPMIWFTAPFEDMELSKNDAPSTVAQSEEIGL